MIKKKGLIIISIVSIMFITLSIYAYTVIRSNNDKIVEKNVIEYVKNTNKIMYSWLPVNFKENIEIIEKRNIDGRTFFIVHQRDNNSILKEFFHYPVTEGLSLDDYIMIEKIDHILTYPEYRQVNHILINNQNLEQCNNYIGNGFCQISFNGIENRLTLTGINMNNASKIKLTFKNNAPIIIDVKDKPYILEIIKMEKDFDYDVTSNPEVEFIYD